MNNYMEEFRAQLSQFGLAPEHIVADGQVQRFPVNGRNKNGWYVLFCDSEGAGGAFGNWAEGLSEKWTSESVCKCDDPERRARFLAKVEASKREAEEQRQRDAEAAAREASELWNNGLSINGCSNPYLERKQIQGVALKLEAGTPNLLAPMYASGGRLVSVQRIMPDGSKLFLKGGSTKGVCCFIKGKNDRVYVCEGYATAESIHIATGRTTFCAFNAGNLLPVCEQIKTKTSAPIVVCGDNDQWSTKADGTPYNAGWEKANECADKLGCMVYFPQFENLDSKPTDFNDLHCLEGISQVAKQIKDPFDIRKKEILDKVKDWCLVCSGKFSVGEIDKDLNLQSVEEKEYRTEAIMQLVESGYVERDEHKRTIFRTRDMETEYIDLFNSEDVEEEIQLNFPFGIGESVVLSPRNIVTVQGENNAGKTSFAFETLLMNLNAGTSNGRNFYYISSEMSQSELKKTAARFAPLESFRGCEFMHRPFEPYDIIHSNPDMRDGIVFIDFLETKGGEYSKTVAEMQRIYDSMRNGIAIVMIQKFEGKEYGKGGQGMLEKPRLAINLSKVFRSEGGSVCVSKIVKCKAVAQGRSNPDGKSAFYIANEKGLTQLSEWGYMSGKGYDNAVGDLKRMFGIVETERPSFLGGKIEVITGRSTDV